MFQSRHKFFEIGSKRETDKAIDCYEKKQKENKSVGRIKENGG